MRVDVGCDLRYVRNGPTLFRDRPPNSSQLIRRRKAIRNMLNAVIGPLLQMDWT